jgi:hypothetical protein
MLPTLNQKGDDRRDGNLSSPYRHRYRHHPKSNGGNRLQMTVTIGDDDIQACAWNKKKQGAYRACVYRNHDLSSPIVTEPRLTSEKQAVSAVTMAVTMQKTGFYRHPHRHRHGVCNGEVTP